MLFAYILIITVTLGYTVFVGFNDGANTIATSIATRAISYRTAVLTVIFSTVAAPILYFYAAGGAESLSVATTIGKTVGRQALSEGGSSFGYAFLFAGVFSGLLWCLFSAKKKLPVSTSHSLLGGISGAGAAAFAFGSIFWESILVKIVATSVAVPLVAFSVSFIIMRLVKKIAYKIPLSSDGIIRKLQGVNVAVISSAIAINNVQKPLGVMYIMFIVSGFSAGSGTVLMIVALSGAVLALGSLMSGGKIIHNVGRKIYKIQPIHSFLAQISIGIVIFAGSGLGIPVSAGQAVSSSVIGVGASEHRSRVNWSNVLRIFVFLVLTYPITFILGALFFYAVSLFL